MYYRAMYLVYWPDVLEWIYGKSVNSGIFPFIVTFELSMIKIVNQI